MKTTPDTMKLYVLPSAIEFQLSDEEVDAFNACARILEKAARESGWGHAGRVVGLLSISHKTLSKQAEVVDTDLYSVCNGKP
jgi:hypothetical protein